MHTELMYAVCTKSPAIINAVFATPEHCLNGAPGGQQQYTRELLATLNEAGVRIHELPLPFARSLRTRLIRKLANRPYRYSYSPDVLTAITESVSQTGSNCVFLNGTTFFGIAKALRELVPNKKLVMFSHGLESTDYVHELNSKGCDGSESRVLTREVGRLGRQLMAERQALQVFDATVALSPVDAEINRWLGATHSIWLPRAVAASPIEWAPIKSRVGFVGTLDHPPNYEGMHRVLHVVERRQLDLTVRIVGGPERTGRKLQNRFRCVEYLGPLTVDELKSEACSWRAFLHPIFCFARGASTKLTTAINWGIPIVTSTAGRRGYEWKVGSLIEANSPDSFVDEVSRLASNDSYMMEVRCQTLKIADNSPTISTNAKQLRQSLDSAFHGVW